MILEKPLDIMRHYSSRIVLMSSVTVISLVLVSACSGGSPPEGGASDVGGGDGAGGDSGSGGASGSGGVVDSGNDAGTDSPAEAAPPADCSAPFTDGASTLSGCSESGDADGPRGEARFWNPVNVAYRDGQVYVADFDNGKLRSIGTDTHFTTSIDPGPNFRRPFGLAFATDETLYVSTDNNPDGANSDMTGTVWRVHLPTKTAKVVASNMGRPRGIVVLPDDRIAATDFLHHVVEIIDPDTGVATVIAGVWDEPGMADGSGEQARFDHPCGIGVMSGNTLVVADSHNNRIRLVTLDGTASTLAGTGAPGYSDGSVDAAMFNRPLGVSLAAGGDVFVADSDNYRIRLISGGSVTTVAGDGVAGHVDDDDPLSARFYGLEGLAVMPDGETLYIADGNRGEDELFNRVREVKLSN